MIHVIYGFGCLYLYALGQAVRRAGEFLFGVFPSWYIVTKNNVDETTTSLITCLLWRRRGVPKGRAGGVLRAQVVKIWSPQSSEGG